MLTDRCRALALSLQLKEWVEQGAWSQGCSRLLDTGLHTRTLHGNSLMRPAAPREDGDRCGYCRIGDTRARSSSRDSLSRTWPLDRWGELGFGGGGRDVVQMACGEAGVKDGSCSHDDVRSTMKPARQRLRWKTQFMAAYPSRLCVRCCASVCTRNRVRVIRIDQISATADKTRPATRFQGNINMAK